MFMAFEVEAGKHDTLERGFLANALDVCVIWADGLGSSGTHHQTLHAAQREAVEAPRSVEVGLLVISIALGERAVNSGQDEDVSEDEIHFDVFVLWL